MYRVLIIVLLSLSLGSCIVFDMYESCESLEEGELRFAYPSKVPTVKEKFHLPTFCHKFYNDGTGRWIECMGVGLK